MARTPNTETAAERKERHVAKMAGKKFDRDRAYAKFLSQKEDDLKRLFVENMQRLAKLNTHPVITG